MNSERRPQPFMPLPTQFLQPEASEDDEEEMNFLDEDDEFEQPLMQIKINSGTVNNPVVPVEANGISSNVFYGIAQTSQENQLQTAAPQSVQYSSLCHDYRSSSAFESQAEGFDVPALEAYSGVVVEETFPAYTSEEASHESNIIYAQDSQSEPRILVTENNRYAVVGHTQEGQPIYALQSALQNDSKVEHQGMQVYRLPSTSSNYSSYSYTVAPEVSQQKYYTCSDGIVTRLPPSSSLALSDDRTNTSRIIGQQPLIVDSASFAVQQNSGSVKTRRKGLNDEEEQRQAEQINDSAVAAQASAIQRFSTLAGWKQMGTWLKTAEKNRDWNRLKLLLSQCAQAQLTVDLLQSNDTPKFIRRLSKTCADVDVRKVAGDLVIRWKKLISAPPAPNPPQEPKRVGSAKRKTPHPTSSDTAKKLVKKAVEHHSGSLNVRKANVIQVEKADKDKNTVVTPAVKESTKEGISEQAEKLDKSKNSLLVGQKPLSKKLNEFNLFEKLDEERNKEKKKRPKTVKTFGSKFRSTGSGFNEKLLLISELFWQRYCQLISNINQLY